MKQDNAPVLMHIFNRPEMVKTLIQEIIAAKPSRVYVSSDAPRPGKPGEAELSAECRRLVVNAKWECELKINFNDTNLGTRYALHSAISWFFDHEEMGIILEEDCLPNQSFFRFCNELLYKYREDHRIMHISGVNQQFGQKVGNASYYFSNFPSIWGWASWRRVWKLYDIKMSLFPQFEAENVLANVFIEPEVVKYAYTILRQTYEDKNMTWDHQLAFTIITNNGLCVVPNCNLVSNIGVLKVGKEQRDAIVGNIPTIELEEDIVHPLFFVPDKKADINQLTWTYDDTTTSRKTFYAKKPIAKTFKERLRMIKMKFFSIQSL